MPMRLERPTHQHDVELVAFEVKLSNQAFQFRIAYRLSERENSGVQCNTPMFPDKGRKKKSSTRIRRRKPKNNESPLSMNAIRYISASMGSSRRSIFLQSLLSCAGVRYGGGGRVTPSMTSIVAALKMGEPSSIFTESLSLAISNTLCAEKTTTKSHRSTPYKSIFVSYSIGFERYSCTVTRSSTCMGCGKNDLKHV